MNTTRAIIKKFMIFEIRSPYENVELPTLNLISFKSPMPGVSNPINGFIMSFTKAVINLDAACPMTNAMASPITENACKKSMNSLMNVFFTGGSSVTAWSVNLIDITLPVKILMHNSLKYDLYKSMIFDITHITKQNTRAKSYLDNKIFF
jgi:hypothetical protein